jgi:hypothetical protein
MTPELKVKRLDSPLNRNTAGERRSEPAPAAAPAKPRRRPGTAAAPRLASVATEPREDSAPAAATHSLPDPPPLDEALELISSRLPRSLRRSLTELTAALRARSGERLSQKSLPEQEVLAVLIWAAGSAADPDAVARLAASVSEFRARRYAAAAEALRS